MSSIAEKTYNNDLTNWLEGSSSLDELINEVKADYGFENIVSAYFLILNPDHSSYDEQLSLLEIDFEGVSVIPSNQDLQIGYIEEGEVGRIMLFPNTFTVEQLKEKLNVILLDYLILK